MSFSALLKNLADHYGSVIDQRTRPRELSILQGLRVPLLSALVQQSSNPRLIMVVVATTRELDRVQLALESLNPDAHIVQFPAWETLPHERQSPSARNRWCTL